MAWDASEPADDVKIADLGTVIRANQDAVAGGTVALTSSRYAATSNPAAVPSHGFVYAKDVTSKAELHYLDEGSVSVQLTSGGLSLATTLVGKAATDLAITSTAAKDINVTLGDAVGANKISFIDTGAVEVAKIDSDGNFQCDGTCAVTGAVTLSSTLAVTGAAALSSTLAVTGATTLSSTVNAKVGDAGDAAQAINSLIPVAWGYFNSSGVLQNGKNLAINAATTGQYTIDIQNYTPSATDYCVIGSTLYSAARSGFSVNSLASVTQFIINTRDQNGTLANIAFMVMVFDV